MRFKPITFSAVLVLALCGATRPAAEPGGAAPATAFDAAFEPAASPPPENPSTATADPAPSPPAAEAAAVPTPEPSASAAAEAPPAPDTGPPPAEGAAPAERPPIPAKGKPPTREYFVGVWAEAGKSCETALDFKADGTLIGPFPRWELTDAGELTMVGNRQKIFLTVVDANTMQSRRAPTDPPRTLKRCGGG